jgi:hypothetical protein
MESHTPDPIRDAARHEQNQHGDPRTHAAPTKTSRGGWKWGDSQSSRIRNAAADYLREKGEPATGPEICDAIMKMGVSIKGQRSEKAVTAKLRPPLFDHTRDGYILPEWSNDDRGARM